MNVMIAATVDVDVADARFSHNRNEILRASSLGCRIGVALFDPAVKCGGVMVFILPNAELASDAAFEQHPYRYADTAIPLFIQTAIENGIRPERSKIAIAGGGKLSTEENAFDLGARNAQAAMDILAQLGLEPVHQNIGLRLNRTLGLDLKTGVIHISVAGTQIAVI